MKTPETLYEVFNQAAAYVAKAKALDPEFKETLTFEKALNKTQTALVYILAMNVIEVGKNTVSAATAKYEKSAEFCCCCDLLRTRPSRTVDN